MDKMSTGTYSLVVIYSVFFILVVFRIKNIVQFIRKWSAIRLMYFGIACLQLVRTACQCCALIYSISDKTLGYIFQVIMFSFPEFMAQPTYVCVVFTWLDAALFSRVVIGRRISRSLFRLITRVVCLGFFLLVSVFLVVMYALLMPGPSLMKQERTANTQEWVCCILSVLVISTCLLLSIGVYYTVIRKNPSINPLANDLLRKLTVAFGLWTLGRLFRASVMMSSLLTNWESDYSKNVQGVLLVILLVISEILPCMYVLDWSMICVLLVSEDLVEHHAHHNSVHLSDDDHSNTSYLLNSQYIEEGLAQFDNSLDLTTLRLPVESTDHNTVHAAYRCTALKDIPQVQFCCKVWSTSTGVIDILGKPTRVVVKRFFLEGLAVEGLKQNAVELRISNANCRVEGVIPLLSADCHKGCLTIIYPFYSRRSLCDQRLQIQRDLAPMAIQQLALRISTILERLHRQNTIHCNQKSRNVLLDEQLVPFIQDESVKVVKLFGEALIGSRMYTAWTAPEVILGGVATKANDVYAFGVICWEIVFRKEPFGNYTQSQLLENVGKKGEKLPLPRIQDVTVMYEKAMHQGRKASVIHPDFILLIDRCLREPEVRPSFSDLVESLTNIIETISKENA